MALITSTITAIANAAHTIGATMQKKPALQTLRWNTAWDEYITPPQQVFDRQEVFSLLDPDGVLDFLALLRGLMSAQSMYASRRILSLTDPLHVTPETVDLALTNVGGIIDPQQTFAQKVEMLRRHVPWMLSRGTAASIVEALSFLGYTGYALNVWVDPTRLGTSREFTLRPIGWFDLVSGPQYHLSSGIAIVLNRTAVLGDFPLTLEEKRRVAKFLKLTVLPAHTYIRFFLGSAPMVLAETGIGADSVVQTEVDPMLVCEGHVQAVSSTTVINVELNP